MQLFHSLRDQTSVQKLIVIKGLLQSHEEKDELLDKITTWTKRKNNQKVTTQTCLSTAAAPRHEAFNSVRSLSYRKFPAVFNPEYVNQVLFLGLAFQQDGRDVCAHVCGTQLKKGDRSDPVLVFNMIIRFPDEELKPLMQTQVSGTIGEAEALNPVILIELLKQMSTHVKCLIMWESSSSLMTLIRKSMAKSQTCLRKNQQPSDFIRNMDIKRDVAASLRKRKLLIGSDVTLEDALRCVDGKVKEEAVAFQRSIYTGFVFDKLRDDLSRLLTA